MKRWTFVLIPVLVLGSLIGWRITQKRAETAGQEQMRQMRKNAPALVSTAAASVRDVIHTFRATGTIESPQNVKIAPKVTGRVDYLLLREGDRVRKGQVLVKIDPRQVEAEVHQQQAALAEAQYRLAQAQVTQNSTNVGVNAQVRQQKAGVNSAKADYRQTKQNYEAQMAAANASVTDAQAKIDNAKAAIKSAQANLDNAKAKYSRVQNLYTQGFIAAQDVDDAKATVSVQQSALEIAQGQLESATAVRDSAKQQASIVKTKGQADIEAAQAKVEQAQASYDYAAANTSQKSAYQQSIAALRAGVEAARAALRSAQAQMADTVLVSPLDGYVTGRYVDPGAMVSAGQAILSVQFVKQVWVTISVPEEVSSMVHIGQPTTVTVDALPNQRFSGSVIQFNPSADLQSRQFQVRVLLSNAGNRFKPGMFARVSLETDRVKNAIVVPREAIKNGKLGATVTVVEMGKMGGKAVVRPVTTGVSDDDYTAIDSGLKPGEKVVTLSAMPVRDGMKIITAGGKGRGHGRPGMPGGARP